MKKLYLILVLAVLIILPGCNAGNPAHVVFSNTEGETYDLANLNSLINDATLDDASATRTPSAHTVDSHSDTSATGTELEELTDSSETTLHSHAVQGTEGPEAGEGLIAHDLGGESHNADSLANLNSLINDATLDDASATRTPSAHTVDSHSDTSATGTELEELTDSSETTLHSHAVGGGASGKSGSRQVPSETWTAVTFNTAFDDANYAITFGVETPTAVNDWKMLFYRNKVAAGFEIYTKEKSGNTVYIDWVATPYNDP